MNGQWPPIIAFVKVVLNPNVRQRLVGQRANLFRPHCVYLHPSVGMKSVRFTCPPFIRRVKNWRRTKMKDHRYCYNIIGLLSPRPQTTCNHAEALSRGAVGGRKKMVEGAVFRFLQNDTMVGQRGWRSNFRRRPRPADQPANPVCADHGMNSKMKRHKKVSRGHTENSII